jgi:nucleoside-diphosphate-sugar epimerase
MVKVFLTGATGYIGGTVLSLLLQNKERFTVTTIARTKEQATRLTELGVDVKIATLDDSDVLTKCAAEAEVIFNLASVSHVGAVKALLAGLKEHQGGPRPIFFQISGSSIVMENSHGEKSTVLHTDKEMKYLLPSLDKNSPPYKTFEETYKFAIENNTVVDVIIVAPTLVFGIGTGPFNVRSLQVPWMVKAALKEKQGVYVGKGENIWSTITIDELGRVFMHLLEKAMEGTVPVNREGFYFVESDETNFVNVASAIQTSMSSLRMSNATAPKSLTEQEAKRVFEGNPKYDADLIGKILGSNSRVFSAKLRDLGWKPKKVHVSSRIDEEIEYWRSVTTFTS